ncbi:MAG: hypothetical protein ACTSYS_13825 [Promethearchaeota archaeon]
MLSTDIFYQAYTSKLVKTLKKQGGQTLKELSREMGLSPYQVRRVINLIKDKIKTEKVVGRIGRPATVYSLRD